MKRTADAKIAHFFDDLHLRMHIRNDIHLVRRTWHMMMGLLIVLVYMSGLSRGTSVLILSSVLAFDLVIESARLRSRVFNEKVLRFWKPFMRAHEVNQMSTAPHYLAATILAIGIFPKPVAILSILYLACGDPIASVFGILHGHRSVRFANGKTLIGTLAGVSVCFLLTLIYLKSLGMSDGAVLGISLLGGIAGGMAELLPLDVDDNFTIPVISGFVLWLAFMAVGF